MSYLERCPHFMHLNRAVPSLRMYSPHTPPQPPPTTTSVHRLDLNYHYEEGVCLPRSTIYEHYLDFCDREGVQPVINAASFGKVCSSFLTHACTLRLHMIVVSTKLPGIQAYSQLFSNFSCSTKYSVLCVCRISLARKMC